MGRQDSILDHIVTIDIHCVVLGLDDSNAATPQLSVPALEQPVPLLNGVAQCIDCFNVADDERQLASDVLRRHRFHLVHPRLAVFLAGEIEW